MNLFEQQAHARRRTALYVLLFVLATVVIVLAANMAVLWVAYIFSPVYLALDRSSSFWTHQVMFSTFDQWLSSHSVAVFKTTVVTLGLVIGMSLYRIVTLARGGGKVALDVGATLVHASTQDPRTRQLLNVVEETAIAVGVPVPEVYVLGGTGINAFVAGFTMSDAAITVTRGALKHLTRDELQGVIGHEFSHILNGDMRLNTGLVGLLYGIAAIWLTGRAILRFPHPLVATIGIPLTVIGFLGALFAWLIQAAVSRSRESLADASAMQFTRNSSGLAGALKKIAVVGSGCAGYSMDEVCHMLIADGGVGSSTLFATHPPILERIRAIEPHFDPEELKHIRLAPAQEALGTPTKVATAAIKTRISPKDVATSAGQLNSAALAVAADHRAGIPAMLADAARTPTDVVPLVLAMVLTDHPEDRSREIESICVKLALRNDASVHVIALAQEIERLDEIYRLPLLQISFPALRRHTPAQLRALIAVVEELSRLDGRVTVFEYVLARLLRLQLYEVIAPRARRSPTMAPSLYRLRGEAQMLISTLAQAGGRNAREARAAYEKGVRGLFPKETPVYMPVSNWLLFDDTLDRLDLLAALMKQQLIEALVLTVLHDQQVRPAEAELLRVICASLHCPLPPLVAGEAA